MNIHYALQTCDSASSQTNDRITGTSKKEITKRCVTSFFNSVQFASNVEPSVNHSVHIFDYNSSQETIDFLLSLKTKHPNIGIELERIDTKGVMSSIKKCYDFLEKNGSHLVYQVQDDYLFHPHAIVEMISVFLQLKEELKEEIVVTPYNDPMLWLRTYRNRTTPRTIFAGSSRYWIQTYDVSCSFMTSHEVFMKNKDLRDLFLSFPDTGDEHGNLENKSLNYMFTQRGTLGIAAFNSLALHIQSGLEKDPYIKWEQWWDEFTE